MQKTDYKRNARILGSVFTCIRKNKINHVIKTKIWIELALTNCKNIKAEWTNKNWAKWQEIQRFFEQFLQTNWIEIQVWLWVIFLH